MHYDPIYHAQHTPDIIDAVHNADVSCCSMQEALNLILSWKLWGNPEFAKSGIMVFNALLGEEKLAQRLLVDLEP